MTMLHFYHINFLHYINETTIAFSSMRLFELAWFLLTFHIFVHLFETLTQGKHKNEKLTNRLKE